MTDTVSAIDLGSNTLRLMIARAARASGPKPEVLLHKRRITRLAEGFDAGGRLSEEALERTASALLEFAGLMEGYGVTRYRAAGTSALREAVNGPQALEELSGRSGLKLEVIGGEEEAALTARGVLAFEAAPPPPALIVDLGGGSLEWIYWDGETTALSESMRVGVVKLCDRYLENDPPSGPELIELRGLLAVVSADIKKKLTAHPRAFERLVATAGTATTLASLDLGLGEYDRQRIQGHVIDLERLLKMRDALVAVPARERLEMPGLEPGREDLIVPGIEFMIELMRAFGFARVTISDGGLLDGLLIELMEEASI